MKQIIFMFLLCVSYNSLTLAQNLNSMPIAKRDSLLIAIAKEAVLKYGPDYYREYKTPVIITGKFPPAEQITDKRFVKLAGRSYYLVTFLYDKTQEQLSYDFAAEVRIWEDTVSLFDVMFGNGWGRGISEDIEDWRKDITIEPVRYRQRQVMPIWDLADQNPNKKPLNVDELKRRGYVEQSNGQWVKVTQDTPPAEAQRVIRRALEEIRRKTE